MKIGAHGWELELAPEHGGAIVALRHAGRDILCPVRHGSHDPLDSACFPLVPYANRIADGRFRFAGQSYALPRNFGDHPHSLHGLGWQAAWRVAAQAEDGATLSHTHDGGSGWPWPYRATQLFALAPGCASVTITLTNLSEQAVPGGIGLHPYFPRGSLSRLTARAQQLWLADATMLPTRATDPAQFGDFAAGASLDGETLIDNAYAGWDGIAEIEQGDGVLRMEAEGAAAFHLFRPPGEAFFCVEPVSHLPDAINRGTMPVLQPGATAALTMRLRPSA